jgi:hypothetical protein
MEGAKRLRNCRSGIIFLVSRFPVWENPFSRSAAKYSSEMSEEEIIESTRIIVAKSIRSQLFL